MKHASKAAWTALAVFLLAASACPIVIALFLSIKKALTA